MKPGGSYYSDLGIIGGFRVQNTELLNGKVRTAVIIT